MQRMTSTDLNQVGMQGLLHDYIIGLRVPSFTPFALWLAVLNIAHSLGFPINSNVKILVSYVCKTWPKYLSIES